MAKNNNDYDSVFKTLKVRDTRLFIPVINEVFGKRYSFDAKIELISPEGQLITNQNKGEADIADRASDMVVCIDEDRYIVECQSYKDGSIAIRIAEYSFIVAKNNAVNENGQLHIRLPYSVVVYVKDVKDLPPVSEIIYELPDGSDSLRYEQKNVFLTGISKEEMLEKRLLPFLPFYITRYEKELESEGDVSKAIEDLEYIKAGLVDMYKHGKINSNELLELLSYTNTIITHITDGNKVEKEVTKVMGGGVILESPVDKIREEAIAEFREQLTARDEQILAQKNQLTARDEQILAQKNQLTKKDEQLTKKDEQLTKKDEQLTKKDEQLTKKDEQLTKKDEQLTVLEQRNAELEAMVRSLGGKI